MNFGPYETRMREAGQPELAIEAFRRHYGQLRGGATGLMPEASVTPVDGLPDMADLGPALAEVGRGALAQVAVVKLNGGLGTSMGLSQAKSLLPVKDGLSFLDLVARQVRGLGCPLMLMNSFATRADSLAALAPYGGLSGALPADFVQHKVPKVDRQTLAPVVWPAAPALTWCPPGHGDLYTALVTRGVIDALRTAGYRYLFVSNVDNLGATLDLRLLGHVVAGGLPFLMEATDRTPMDRKGGHLVRVGGRLSLREAAQCRPEDAEAFQDIARHRYFNTNNLWIDLEALAAHLRRHTVVSLPLIRNAKTVDPRDPESTPVYQLESAMGAALSVFDGAAAIRVPRARFAPVKTCDDLLVVRSDAYVRSAQGQIVLHHRRMAPPEVRLDPRYFKTVQDLDARAPLAPSLVDCDRLTVLGDVRFGEGVVVRGHVRIEASAPLVIPDGTVLEG